MMPTDLRVPMTWAAFDAMPECPHGLFAELLDSNLLLTAAFEAVGDWYAPSLLTRMTPGQKAAQAYSEFGYRRDNAGIGAALSDPARVAAVHRAAIVVGQQALSDALSQVEADDYARRGTRWFDAVFDTALDHLAVWIKAHPDEFIRPPDGAAS